MWGDLQILGEVALAMVLGGLIGFEREQAGKPAGLKTHMLVAGGACLFVALGHLIFTYYTAVIPSPADVVRVDPIRIIEAVVTGISFLGAGTIIKTRDAESVEGLTTAASVLMAAAIGITVAVGRWALGIGIVGLVLLVLLVIKRIEHRVNLRSDS